MEEKMHNKTTQKQVFFALLAITLLFAVSCDDTDNSKSYNGTINGLSYDLTIFDGQTFELTVDGKICKGTVQGEQNGTYVLLGNGSVFYVTIESGKITGATGTITFDNGDKFFAGSSSTGGDGSVEKVVDARFLGKWAYVGYVTYTYDENNTSFETFYEDEYTIGAEITETQFNVYTMYSSEIFSEMGTNAYTDDKYFYFTRGNVQTSWLYRFENNYLYLYTDIYQKIDKFSWE